MNVGLNTYTAKNHSLNLPNQEQSTEMSNLAPFVVFVEPQESVVVVIFLQIGFNSDIIAHFCQQGSRKVFNLFVVQESESPMSTGVCVFEGRECLTFVIGWHH